VAREPTHLKTVLDARGWSYLRFRREYERTAQQLGLGAQTIGRRQFERWARGLLVTAPRPDACMILEHLLGEPAAVLLSPAEHVPATADSGPVALVVAIALVVYGHAVLLVRRRRPEGLLDWQFPAGIVKPCDQPAQVAAAEVAAETGIAVNVRERIGCRVHPITGAQCEYFLCDYLHGQPANLDPQENAEVAWAPIAGLDRYIDPELIYVPARDALMRRQDA
jgi:8-oxo-dGTP diphosphatase